MHTVEDFLLMLGYDVRRPPTTELDDNVLAIYSSGGRFLGTAEAVWYECAGPHDRGMVLCRSDGQNRVVWLTENMAARVTFFLGDSGAENLF